MLGPEEQPKSAMARLAGKVAAAVEKRAVTAASVTGFVIDITFFYKKKRRNIKKNGSCL